MEEVQKKRKESKVQRERETYRLKAKLFNKVSRAVILLEIIIAEGFVCTDGLNPVHDPSDARRQTPPSVFAHATTSKNFRWRKAP